MRVIDVLDLLDVDQESYLFALPRRCRSPQDRSRRSPVLSMQLPPPLEQTNSLRTRIKLERRAFPVQNRARGARRHGAELHDHGNAACACQHGDVARGAAAEE